MIWPHGNLGWSKVDISVHASTVSGFTWHGSLFFLERGQLDQLRVILDVEYLTPIGLNVQACHNISVGKAR